MLISVDFHPKKICIEWGQKKTAKGENEMEEAEANYEVTLQAPIGRRSGRMRVWSGSGRINGELDLLQNTTQFQGTIDGNGNFTVTGELITFMRKIPYSADGLLNGETVKMTLYTKSGVFELDGVKTEKAEERL